MAYFSISEAEVFINVGRCSEYTVIIALTVPSVGQLRSKHLQAMKPSSRQRVVYIGARVCDASRNYGRSAVRRVTNSAAQRWRVRSLLQLFYNTQCFVSQQSWFKYHIKSRLWLMSCKLRLLCSQHAECYIAAESRRHCTRNLSLCTFGALFTQCGMVGYRKYPSYGGGGVFIMQVVRI
jgi:hypothetical protein